MSATKRLSNTTAAVAAEEYCRSQKEIIPLDITLARAVGVEAAVMYRQLLYWTMKMPREWIYLSSDEWEQQTTLTYRQQTRARKILVRRGLMEYDLRRNEGNTSYFRVVPEALQKMMAGHASAQRKHVTPRETLNETLLKGEEPSDKMAEGYSQNVRSLSTKCHFDNKEQENTQETTQENTQESSQNTEHHLAMMQRDPAPTVQDRYVLIRDKLLTLCNCDTLDDSPTTDARGCSAMIRMLDDSVRSTDDLLAYLEQWALEKGVDDDPARLLAVALKYIRIGEHPGIDVPA